MTFWGRYQILFFKSITSIWRQSISSNLCLETNHNLSEDVSAAVVDSMIGMTCVRYTRFVLPTKVSMLGKVAIMIFDERQKKVLTRVNMF